MAIEKFKEELRVFETERSVPLPKPPSIYACAVFGEGRWSCPADCPNLQVTITRDPAEIALKCKVVSSELNDFLDPELRSIGIVVRQREQRPFLANPNGKV